ncbi:NfeD family protein [Nitratifractor sp.]
MAIAWWIWIVLGMVLVVSELLLSSFILLWLGVAALVVGMLHLIFVLSLSAQLYWWSILSVALLLLWFGYFRRTRRLSVGQSEGEYAHIPGKILESKGDGRYLAEFDLPVLGDRRWIVESAEELHPGDPIEVRSVHGQIIKVKKARR